MPDKKMKNEAKKEVQVFGWLVGRILHFNEVKIYGLFMSADQ
jgi:hypothetical protein